MSLKPLKQLLVTAVLHSTRRFPPLRGTNPVSLFSQTSTTFIPTMICEAEMSSCPNSNMCRTSPTSWALMQTFLPLEALTSLYSLLWKHMFSFLTPSNPHILWSTHTYVASPTLGPTEPSKCLRGKYLPPLTHTFPPFPQERIYMALPLKKRT